MRSGINLNFEERILQQSDLVRFPTLGTSMPARIPDPGHAEGRIKQFGIRPGLVSSLYDMRVSEQFGGSAYTDPCVSIATFIAATGTGVIEHGDPAQPEVRIPYVSGYTYVSFMRNRTFGRYELPLGSRFFGVEVRASLEFLERLEALHLFEKASADHPLHLVSTAGLWIGRFPLARVIRETTQRLLDAGLEQGDDLSVEARSLDILTAAIAIMREPLYCGSVRLARDIRKLDEARALIMTDVARPWTIAALAREVGLSERRLKTGFREYLGQPVHGFLLRSRLHAAKAMLDKRDRSITEIALAVGYANPSHFAHLFRREFGVKPSTYSASFGD
jgi:AraC-like DNA-binding protein